MSLSSEKVAIGDEPSIGGNLNYLAKDCPQDVTGISDKFSEEETQLTAQEAGDAALANSPWQYRMIALTTALLFPLGSHFSLSAIGAMKGSIKSNLHINNTQYGVLSSSVSIINTVFPIAGGILIDMFGSVWGTLVINTFVITGSLLTAIAAKYKSYELMVVGRIIFGIGSGLIVTMQESILSKWFRTQNLSIALGLQISISKTATFLGILVANPIAVRTGDWVWSLWLSFILCCFSILMNLVYALVVIHLRQPIDPITGKTAPIQFKEGISKAKSRKTFHWKSILKFPTIFWHILLIEFLFAAVWESFQTISTEFVKLHFGIENNLLAGYTASASQSIAIAATPIIGVIMDVFGLRIAILLTSAICLIVSSAFLGWTYVNATVGMIFYSMSFAFGPISMITSIGMILPSDYIGTGLGLFKASNSIGTTILDIVIGVVQDHTAHQAYTGVMVLFVAIACIGFVVIVMLWLSQYYFYDNLLDASRKTRLARMEERSSQEIALNKQGLDSYNDNAINPLSYVYIGIFIACLLTAWTLFFVYAVSGEISA